MAPIGGPAAKSTVAAPAALGLLEGALRCVATVVSPMRATAADGTTPAAAAGLAPSKLGSKLSKSPSAMRAALMARPRFPGSRTGSCCCVCPVCIHLHRGLMRVAVTRSFRVGSLKNIRSAGFDGRYDGADEWVGLLRGITKPEAMLACALYVGGACVFFRQQIFSSFDLYFGDRGDARLILFVHEHVYRALLGETSFLSPPEFYDLKNTLGGSDAFVLNQLVYAPLRLLGADPYLALFLSMLLLSALAFIAMCGLLTRRLGVPLALAAPVALLAIFPNNLFEKTAHLQKFAIYFAPLLAWWMFHGVAEIHRQPGRGLRHSGSRRSVVRAPAGDRPLYRLVPRPRPRRLRSHLRAR